MAKNKSRDRKQPAERAPQTAQQPSMEPQDEQRSTQVTPGDMARKGRGKRFGHN
ncbi:hypothetical protein [Streptomyces sp. ALI-76-A]|jgi:hypothetical protein|uniref:hypothetical protein n=1 Tax=Streptomyces sp. ALI-76-A TaxID=3025736 RepID=UPI00256F2515|nr:hypothetical protein [Streptomyces sp. ALI-76-A]MDL5201025.1 hypothetical protein [Streptomyces sp. ALI-76-A]